MRVALAFLSLAVATAFANPPVILTQPAKPSTAVSPGVSTTSQANQQLLNQINATLTQRRIEHQIVTTRAALLSQPATIAPRIIIQQK